MKRDMMIYFLGEIVDRSSGFEIHCFDEFGGVRLALCDDNDRYADLVV